MGKIISISKRPLVECKFAVITVALVLLLFIPTFTIKSNTINIEPTQVVAPVIESICPSSPQAIFGDQTVEVRGINFQTGLTVTVFFPNGGSATLSGAQIGLFSSAEFVMSINFNGNPGQYSIRVNNPSGALSPMFSFQVSQSAQKPRIFSINPASPIGNFGFQNVKVNGDNFKNNSTVSVTRQGIPVPTSVGMSFGCTGLSMQVDFQGIGGSYTVTARNPDSGLVSDPFSFTVLQVCNLPMITAQPIDQMINSGQQAGLVVAVSGSSPLSYQWYQGLSGNTSNPVGINSASFTTPILTSTTTYWVRISNSCGITDSRTVTVFVGATCMPPLITAQPVDQSIISGQQAGLVVAVSGSSPLSYQWYQGLSGNTSNPVGINSASFTTPILTSTTTYWVRISNSCGITDSRTVTVNIVTCTLSCTASARGTGTVGLPVAFAATATPSGCSATLSFDWDFGDGTSHSAQQNPKHIYTTAGTYTWVVVADTASTDICVHTGTIVISAVTQSCITASVVPAGSGTVSLSPSGPCYNSGSIVTLTASPTGSFTFDHWSGGASGSSNPLIITMNNSKTVIANFVSPVPPTAIIRRPPYDFFNGCNHTNTIGVAESIVLSLPQTGEIDVDVKATLGGAFGKAGNGIVYTPNFSGRVKLKAAIQINPPSFDILSVIGLPEVGVIGIVSINSDVYITADVDGANSRTATRRFKSGIITPISDGTGSGFGIISDLHRYTPAEVFSVELEINVVNGQPIRICAGIQSEVASSTVLPGFIIARGNYTATLLNIAVTPQ